MSDRRIFREESLERLSSPERLDQLMAQVDPRPWLPLAALGGLVALLLIWSVVGEVAVQVEGRGVLLRPRTIAPIQAPGAGRLASIHVTRGERVRQGQLLAEIERPELSKQLDLEQSKLIELQALGQQDADLRSERASLQQQSTLRHGGSLRGQMEDYAALADELRDQGLKALASEREHLDRRLTLARTLADSLEAQLERQRGLVDEGLLAEGAITELETDRIDALQRVADLENQQRLIETRRLQIEERYLEAHQRVDEMRFSVEGLDMRAKELAQENLDSRGRLEQEIADTMREIERLEARLDDEAEIHSQHAGLILELNATPGELVVAGARIAVLQIEDASRPLEAVSYFTIGDGKRLDQGDDILITPDTVERQRYGSLRGVIRSIATFPVTLAEVENTVGNAAVAEQLIRGGQLIAVVATLQPDPGTSTGFGWTTSKGPPIAITAGTTTTTRVAIEHRKPITFALPIFKRGLGVD